MSVRKLPDIRSPSGRLMYYGAKHLSDAELVMVLAGEGDSAVADKLLADCGSLAELRGMTIEEFSEVCGIGIGAAARIMAGAELGGRIVSEPVLRGQEIFCQELY